jgi:amidase
VPQSTLGRPGRLTVAGIIGADLADVALATSIAAGNAVHIPAGDLMCDPARPDGAASPWRVAYPPISDAAVDRVARERLAEVAATDAITVAGPRVELANPTTAWLAIHDAENARPFDAATMGHFL